MRSKAPVSQSEHSLPMPYVFTHADILLMLMLIEIAQKSGLPEPEKTQAWDLYRALRSHIKE